MFFLIDVLAQDINPILVQRARRNLDQWKQSGVHYEYVNEKRVFIKHRVVVGIVDGNNGNRDLRTEKLDMGVSRQNRLRLLGPIVQSGMNAAFAMQKSRVQIPLGPLTET